MLAQLWLRYREPCTTALETIQKVLKKRCFSGVSYIVWKGGLNPCVDESFVSIEEVCLVWFYQYR